MHRLGLIHGRFQVVHNDHLKYLLAGKALCEHLIIGVTNPTTGATAEESSNPERSKPENNPLTYDERKAMIRAAFGEAGIPADTYSVIPFPICMPDKLREMAPREAIYYLTIYDDWGRKKLERLSELGLETHVMWDRKPEEKGISGKDVRSAIRTGGEWQTMVPSAVARLVNSWNLQERLSVSSGS